MITNALFSSSEEALCCLLGVFGGNAAVMKGGGGPWRFWTSYRMSDSYWTRFDAGNLELGLELRVDPPVGPVFARWGRSTDLAPGSTPGSHHWIPPLGPTPGSHPWIPPLDPSPGFRSWISPLDSAPGSHPWIPPLGPTPGSAPEPCSDISRSLPIMGQTLQR